MSSVNRVPLRCLSLWFKISPFHNILVLLTYALRNMPLCFWCPTYWKSLTDEEMKTLHTKVDLIVTLGGDGTVLWVCGPNYMTIY